MNRLSQKLLLLLFLCIALQAYSQNEKRFWYFGDQAALDFSSGKPVPVLDSKMSTREGCATVSDISGKLLFYTNGENVWNRNHTIMSNGNNLGGTFDAEQSALAIPAPGSSYLYYIFTVNGTTKELNYSLIDMRQQSGLGAVTSKKNLLHKGSGEALAAVRHCNGRDIWIIIHDCNNSNTFTTYLLSPSGLGSPVQSNTGRLQYYALGYIKFSPDAKTLACFISDKSHMGVGVFDFDNRSGQVLHEKAYLAYTIFFQPDYALEFSPDGSKLYMSGSSVVYQADLSQPDSSAIIRSITNIADPETNGEGLELAPDGKIYHSHYGQDHLGAINRPNEKGTACDLQPYGVSLSGRKCFRSLPEFICSDFNRIKTPIQIFLPCNAGGIHLTMPDAAGADSIRWTVAGPDRQHTTILHGNPVNFPDTTEGNYAIRVEFTKNCVYAYSDTIITLRKLKPGILGQDTLLCPGQQLKLDVTTVGASYYWSDGSTGSSMVVSHPGTYWVQVQQGCSSISDTIQVDYQPPQEYLPGDTTVCHDAVIRLELIAKGKAYLWSDGSTDSFLVVDHPGTYRVKVLRGHCWEEDSIHIKAYPSIWTALGKEYYICEEEDELVKLDAGKGYVDYLWYPTGDTTQWIMVTRQGAYYVVVADFRGCQGRGNTIVKERCPMTLYFPDGFSPNGDGLNDTYGPVGANITAFHMQVYNRWGELVFVTDTMDKGWDGKYKGQDAPEGSYTYMATISGYTHEKTETTVYRKGSVTLER